MNSDQEFGHICYISPRNHGYKSNFGWVCIFCGKRTPEKSHRHRLWQNQLKVQNLMH